MPGTIDSAVTRKSDDDVEVDAKIEQQQAEKRRAEDKREGPKDQAPGAMPPENH